MKRLLFDEFQSENNRYCSNELTKFISLRTSIARGKGEQTRYLPVIMLSNPVSLLNPYYVSFGISDRLQENTKFLRGNGFVLEQNFNESASQAFLSSSFNQAFSGENMLPMLVSPFTSMIINPLSKNEWKKPLYLYDQIPRPLL